MITRKRNKNHKGIHEHILGLPIIHMGINFADHCFANFLTI
jgi:hypothetical protein